MQQSLFPDPPQPPASTNVEHVKEIVGTDHVRFDGAEYNPRIDDERLSGQMLRIFLLMQDAKWRTLEEIAEATGDPQPSISAQLRHFRKKKFGEHTVNRRSRDDRAYGLFEYQLIVTLRVMP